MIQQQTILKVSDNSGAKTVKCLKVLGGFKRKIAKIGDIIVVSIQQLRNRSRATSKVQTGEIYRAVIIRTRSRIQRKDGSTYNFNENAVSLMNKQGQPVATRIIGPVPKKLRKGKFMKFASISTGFV